MFLDFSNFALDSTFLAYSFETYLQAEKLGGHSEFMHTRYIFFHYPPVQKSLTATIELLVFLLFSKLERKHTNEWPEPVTNCVMRGSDGTFGKCSSLRC